MFDGEEVTRRRIALQPDDFKQDLARLKACQDDKQVQEWVVQQGAKSISHLGAEVDRLEVRIKVMYT